MTTLVLVGNAKQPFTRLLEAVTTISSSLPQPVIVQHGNTPFHNPVCESRAFLDRDDVANLMAKSDLIICHAGAGCVMDALRVGRVPVVMPRTRMLGEHVDDHQSEFAGALRQLRKAVVIETPEELQGAVDQALEMRHRPLAVPVEPHLVGLVRDALRAIQTEHDAKNHKRDHS